MAKQSSTLKLKIGCRRNNNNNKNICQLQRSTEITNTYTHIWNTFTMSILTTIVINFYCKTFSLMKFHVSNCVFALEQTFIIIVLCCICLCRKTKSPTNCKRSEWIVVTDNINTNTQLVILKYSRIHVVVTV